jgi:uncharacterized membrane protein
MSRSDHRPTSNRAWKVKSTTASGTNRVPLAPAFMLALAFIGIADAFYDSYVIYTDQLLWCPPPIDGCNIVANSPYARIVDVPLGYFGLVYYLYMFGLAALLAFDPLSRSLRFGSLVYSAIGVCFSIYFMYIQVTFIHAFCIYCLISAVLTLLLFVAALWQFSAIRKGRPATAARTRSIDPGQSIAVNP